jgi:hypothetical protein
MTVAKTRHILIATAVVFLWEGGACHKLSKPILKTIAFIPCVSVARQCRLRAARMNIPVTKGERLRVPSAVTP